MNAEFDSNEGSLRKIMQRWIANTFKLSDVLDCTIEKARNERVPISVGIHESVDMPTVTNMIHVVLDDDGIIKEARGFGQWCMRIPKPR